MKKRVLIVDDSPFVRRLLSDWLNAAPDFEVVGQAVNGLEGVTRARELKPDLITLDVEMPVMTGLEALKRIMAETPTPVLMVSSITKKGAAVTLEALENGAIDFVTKPDGPSSIRLVSAKDEVLEKARAAAGVRMKRSPMPERPRLAPRLQSPARPTPMSSPREASPEPAVRPGPRPTARPEEPAKPIPSLKGATSDRVVVLASSTGGPKALARLFACLPKGFPAPILIVQHMPAGFTESFAHRLDGLGTVPCKEAAEGDKVTPGLALLAPGGKHMEVGKDGRIVLKDGPTLHGVKPAADHLFQSACSLYGGRCLAVILTGMGRDGAEGALAIRRAGGQVLTESESTCTIYGMPRAAVENGASHHQIPIDDMAEAMVNGVQRRAGHAA